MNWPTDDTVFSGKFAFVIAIIEFTAQHMSKFLKEVFVLCLGLRVFLSVKARQVLPETSFFLQHKKSKLEKDAKMILWM